MTASDEFLSLGAASWSALASVATVLVYLALLVYAVKQVGEARRLRGAQARPFVIVDFEPTWLLQLVVQNIGQTAAQDVVMRFDPPLDSSMQKPHPWEESSAFTHGIPLLPPHRKIRVDFDSAHSVYAEDSTFPMRYEVTVTYRGSEARSRPYKDRYVLDLNIFKGTRLPEDGLPEIAKGVAGIKSAIESASRKGLPPGWPRDFALSRGGAQPEAPAPKARATARASQKAPPAKKAAKATKEAPPGSAARAVKTVTPKPKA